MFERLFRKLPYKFDPGKGISLLRSSDDPGLAAYLIAIKAEASTHMDEDGRVYIKILDIIPPSKGTLLEEFAHALQYIKNGNIPLSFMTKSVGNGSWKSLNALKIERIA